ncbi:MAG: protein phosphatase 2C domain-containing protein [Lachnospiraceae bacterium]|jgi:hypothetical protein|nr:protein phosphatase 2C domain-containing protein [Lachnospiraceae bacterium]
MVLFYDYTSIGSSHMEKVVGNQDSIKTERLENGTVIAAVADGVGSCKYSDIASSIAVETSVRVCSEEIMSVSDAPDLLHIIQKAFSYAEQEIDKRSLSDGNLIIEYDTTLSLVIYDGKNVAYGHSGDGGIVGLSSDGDYMKITEPQKKENVYVIPLRAGKDTWIINKAEGNFTSVLLATDGVYDVFFPYLLKGQPVEIYVPLIRYFMDNNVMGASPETIELVGKEREKFLNGEGCASITDDKSIIVLINDKVLPELKEDSYYIEPDWDTLQMEWNKKAYPHLYKDEGNFTTADADSELSHDTKP